MTITTTEQKKRRREGDEKRKEKKEEEGKAQLAAYGSGLVREVQVVGSGSAVVVDVKAVVRKGHCKEALKSWRNGTKRYWAWWKVTPSIRRPGPGTASRGIV